MIGITANAITAMVIIAVIIKMITGSFSMRRAGIEVRSITGESLAVILSVVAISEIMLTGTTVTAALGISDQETASLLVALALIAVFSLATMPRMAVAAMSLVALVAFAIDVTATHGPAVTLMLVIVVVLMLMLTSIVRAFSPI